MISFKLMILTTAYTLNVEVYTDHIKVLLFWMVPGGANAPVCRPAGHIEPGAKLLGELMPTPV